MPVLLIAVSELVLADCGPEVDIAMVVWLDPRRRAHDSLRQRFHRDTFLKYFTIRTIYARRSREACWVQPEEVTDIVDQPCALGSLWVDRSVS